MYFALLLDETAKDGNFMLCFALNVLTRLFNVVFPLSRLILFPALLIILIHIISTAVTHLTVLLNATHTVIESLQYYS